MSRPLDLPPFIRLGLVPLLTIATAFAVSALVVLAIGEDPVESLSILITGALGNAEAIGFTLYYTTGFIFTGLSVALAFQAGLFNIGAEGQATLAGIGATLACLSLDWLPAPLILPLALLAAAAFGGAYAAVPGWLQAKRGSHIVITTIMFNFLSTALLSWLLVGPLLKSGSMQPETRNFSAAAELPSVQSLLAMIGVAMPSTPLSLAFLLALLAALAVWLLVWHTRLGYEIRVVGQSHQAAAYAGISIGRITVVTMALSGALAGGLAVNEVLGVQHRLLLEFTGGAGFVGIAVALMGRAHPLGVCLAALLFGVLYQGGTELAFEKAKITRDMIVVIQGFVVLFAGALDYAFARPLALWFSRQAHGRAAT